MTSKDKLDSFEAVEAAVADVRFKFDENKQQCDKLGTEMEKVNKYVHNELMKMMDLLEALKKEVKKDLKKEMIKYLKDEQVMERLEALEDGGGVDVTEIKKEISVTQVEIEERYKAEILKLQEQIVVLQGRADTSEGKIKEIEDQLTKDRDADLKEEIEKLKKDMDENKKDISENKDEVEKLKDELKKLKEKEPEAVERGIDLGELEELKKSIAEAKACAEKADEKAEKAKKDADENAEKLKKDVRSVRHDMKKLKSKPEGEGADAPVSPREAEVAPSEEVMKAIEDAKDEAEKALKEAKEAKEEAEKAKKEAEEAKEDAEKAKKEAKEAEDKVEALEKEIEKIKSQGPPAGETKTVVERAVDPELVAQLQKAVDDAKKEAKEAKEEAEKAKKDVAAENEKLEKELKSIKHDIKKLRSRKPSGAEPQAQERAVTLDDADDLRDTVDRAKKEAAAAKDEADKANKKIKEIEAMIQYLKNREAGGSKQPDVSQVFVDLPQAAAVQLVFRAQQQVQVVKK